jgi:hypothetical protein
VFASGIWALAILAAALLIAVDGNTLTLIPLYAIGVFTGFTLSQAGLVVHWRRNRPPGWSRRAVINGMVLIPVAVPDRLRYRFLHNHFDVVLSRALRDRSDSITARVPMPLHVPARRGGDAGNG